MFYTSFRELIPRCGYPVVAAGFKADGVPIESLHDQLLRDRIVLGFCDDSLRKQLVSTGNRLTLETNTTTHRRAVPCDSSDRVNNVYLFAYAVR